MHYTELGSLSPDVTRARQTDEAVRQGWAVGVSCRWDGQEEAES